MSLDRQSDRGPPPIPKATRCPKCKSRDVDVGHNANFPSGWDLSCRTCKYEGDGGLREGAP